MPNLNKVMLIGNVTRDPEIKYTPKGAAIADIGLAINRNYTTEAGEKREETTFCDVTLWGKVAEIVGQYVKKGNPLFVEGRLQLDQWDDKQTGQKRSKLKIVGDNIQLLGGKQESTREERRPSTGRSRPPTDPDLGPPDEEEDRIRF